MSYQRSMQVRLDALPPQTEFNCTHRGRRLAATVLRSEHELVIALTQFQEAIFLDPSEIVEVYVDSPVPVVPADPAARQEVPGETY